MSNLANLAEPAIAKLMQSGPDQLYAELGLRRKAIAADPSQAGLFETTATYDAPFAGPLDALKEFGKEFFDQVSKDVYRVVCGTDAKDVDERERLEKAFGIGKAAFASSLAAICVSSFGWAPAIAAVVATLVVKLFLDSAYVSMCKVWKKRLPT